MRQVRFHSQQKPSAVSNIDLQSQVTEEEKADLTDETAVVRVNPFGGEFCRVVTHADVSMEDTMLAIKKLKYVIGEFDKGSDSIILKNENTIGNGYY